MLEKKTITFERAVLIGIINREQPEEKVKEYLDELEFLTYTSVLTFPTPKPLSVAGSCKQWSNL